MCYQCNGYSSSKASYSSCSQNEGIESIVSNYAAMPVYNLDNRIQTINLDAVPQYSGTVNAYSAYSPGNYRTWNGYHNADNFLVRERPRTQFVDDAAQIQEYIKEAFRAAAGEELPQNIQIILCSEDELRKLHLIHSPEWSPSIQGFSINITKQIFIKKGDLDRVMLVIGHELGHVLTPTLKNKRDEEAKAFAFEIEWMKKIVEQDIAGLRSNIYIDFVPANNGLHNVAFNFVRTLVLTGKRALDVYWELVSGGLSIIS